MVLLSVIIIIFIVSGSDRFSTEETLPFPSLVTSCCIIRVQILSSVNTEFYQQDKERF